MNKMDAARNLTKIIGLICYRRFHDPEITGDRFQRVADTVLGKMRWLYVSQVRQIEKAERGSGIEEYFSHRNISIPSSDDPLLTVTAGGDILAVDRINAGSTRNLFTEVQNFYFNADLRCANLESCVDPDSPVGRNQVFERPAAMNTSPEMIKNLYLGGRGINYLSTASNHSNDYDLRGLTNTVSSLDKIGILHSGTVGDPSERPYELFEKNGVRIAILSFTFDPNIPSAVPWYLNEAPLNDVDPDFSEISKQIRSAKDEGADLIFAYMHWGWEFEMYPHALTVKNAHELVDLGIDVIFGSHPHVAQPYEQYTAKDGRDSLIIYSFGDFVTDHPRSMDSRLSYIVRFSVSDKLKICNFDVLPVYTLITGDKSASECRIVPFSSVLNDPSRLTENEKNDLPRLKSVLEKIILHQN
ncbi:MAG: CapA family protein [Oscillospiraceae bacterium]|nr:CapA family protein [Oscillospiraceae bacterium]